MTHKVVAMPLIPGQVRRGKFKRSDLHYAKYSRASWKWWCDKNGIEFIVFDQPLGGAEFADKPPTIQRWLIPDLLIREHGNGTRVALVDADTMIRWDTPDFLDMSENFSAVRGRDTPWISQSINAFQPLFPGVTLTPREYFNAGMVVVGQGELQKIRSFLAFMSQHWPLVQKIIRAGNFGTDQTALNFVLQRENARVDFLPVAFNFLHCFPLDPVLFSIDNSPLPDPVQFAARAFSRPGAFNFCNQGYIWHFSNVVALRSLVMGEVWRRVCGSYPGVELVENISRTS
jgi:hypothetical protein